MSEKLETELENSLSMMRARLDFMIGTSTTKDVVQVTEALRNLTEVWARMELTKIQRKAESVEITRRLAGQ